MPTRREAHRASRAEIYERYRNSQQTGSLLRQPAIRQRWQTALPGPAAQGSQRAERHRARKPQVALPQECGRQPADRRTDKTPGIYRRRIHAADRAEAKYQIITEHIFEIKYPELAEPSLPNEFSTPLSTIGWWI